MSKIDISLISTAIKFSHDYEECMYILLRDLRNALPYTNTFMGTDIIIIYIILYIINGIYIVSFILYLLLYHIIIYISEIRKINYPSLHKYINSFGTKLAMRSVQLIT